MKGTRTDCFVVGNRLTASNWYNLIISYTVNEDQQIMRNSLMYGVKAVESIYTINDLQKEIDHDTEKFLFVMKHALIEEDWLNETEREFFEILFYLYDGLHEYSSKFSINSLLNIFLLNIGLEQKKPKFNRLDEVYQKSKDRKNGSIGRLLKLLLTTTDEKFSVIRIYQNKGTREIVFMAFLEGKVKTFTLNGKFIGKFALKTIHTSTANGHLNRLMSKAIEEDQELNIYPLDQKESRRALRRAKDGDSFVNGTV